MVEHYPEVRAFCTDFRFPGRGHSFDIALAMALHNSCDIALGMGRRSFLGRKVSTGGRPNGIQVWRGLPEVPI